MTPELLAPIVLAATVAIAPVDKALTFARVDVDAGHRVLLVQRYESEEIEAIDLAIALDIEEASDPIDIYQRYGYQALAQLATIAPHGARVRVSTEKLTVPVDLGSHHVAAGTNYPEHAGESGVEDGPFLFAKLVTPTPSRASVAAHNALLDYEVELAWVALDDIRDGTPPDQMGSILCNDYTDRATLLRHVDPWDVASGKGFTTGKSFPGFLPVGDLFVIPRDYRKLAESRVLRLDVNGEPRQRAPVSEHVWDIDRLFAETWKRKDVRWENGDEQVALLGDGDVLPARTLVMAGTPAGTVFQNVGWSHQFKGAMSWVLGFFSGPIAAPVIESYIDDPEVRASYLKADDRVTIRVDYLGTIDNLIVP